MGFGSFIKRVASPITNVVEKTASVITDPKQLTDPKKVLGGITDTFGDFPVGGLPGALIGANRKSILEKTGLGEGAISGLLTGSLINPLTGGFLGLLGHKADKDLEDELAALEDKNRKEREIAGRDLETLALATSLSGRLAGSNTAGKIGAEGLSTFSTSKERIQLSNLEERIKAENPDSEVGKEIEKTLGSLMGESVSLTRQRSQFKTRLSLAS